MKISWFICFMLLCSLAFSQEEFDNLNVKIGVKTDINASLLLGDELQNPRPKFGYSAGVYLQTNDKNNWFFQQEIIASFRGSNFNNNDTGKVYSRISLFYIDVTPLVGYTLAPETDAKHQVLFGPTFSYLALSSVFVKGSKVPLKSDLNLQPIDIGAAVFYQVYAAPVGFQLGLKYGFTNINDGLLFEDVKPTTGLGNTITNFSIEIGMLF